MKYIICIIKAPTPFVDNLNLTPEGIQIVELILTMLSDATTTKLHRDRDSQGIDPLKKDAKDGGAVVGRTHKDIEVQAGKPVVTSENFRQLAGR